MACLELIPKYVSVIGINRLMGSVCLGPKVIPLSGAHCIMKTKKKLRNTLPSNYIKVKVQPGLGNNGSIFGRNLNHQTSYIYKSAGRRAGRQADMSKAC
jgi:hypothetical protein